MKKGCYGLAWTGIDGALRYLNDVDDEAVDVRVVRAAERSEHPAPEVLEPDRAQLPLSDGRSVARVHRTPATVTLSLARDYDDDALLHPLLAGSAAVLNHWMGHDSFHAGAVVLGGRAWIIVGDKGDGKSTTLAYLATRGLPVLADDLIIERDGEALAGPGFVDLRPDAARALGIGRDIGWLGARLRARFDLPARPAHAPVAGWIVLSWSRQVSARTIPLAERLDLLYDSRTVQLDPADPASFLRHAARPFVELSRPKDWEALPQVYDTLLAELS